VVSHVVETSDEVREKARGLQARGAEGGARPVARGQPTIPGLAEVIDALNVPGGSGRWYDRLLDAQDQAVPDSKYTAITNAYDILNENQARAAVQAIIKKYC